MKILYRYSPADAAEDPFFGSRLFYSREALKRVRCHYFFIKKGFFL